MSSNACLNCGKVSFDKSSNPDFNLTCVNTPRSLKTSAAPAPPAKARPNALAASTISVPIKAAKSATAFKDSSEFAPKASN